MSGLIHRHWFLTWTTYGTRLPGDKRGFVSNVREAAGHGSPGVRHNKPFTEYDQDHPGLRKFAEAKLIGPRIFLEEALAKPLFDQFQETARFRNWTLKAVAILINHVHIVTAVTGDPEPEDILRDFKAYASRCLNKLRPRPESGTWWTESGSKRKLSDPSSLLGAVEYVRNQVDPFLVWVHDNIWEGEAAIKLDATDALKTFRQNLEVQN